MNHKFNRFLLYKCMGWKSNVTITIPQKCILCIAPHTSNWDFIIGILYSRIERMQANFLMKKEWFWGPVGTFMRSLGGIPVNRSKKTSLTEQLSDIAKQRDRFQLAVTPEGTRKRNPEWKKGFYYIAEKAGIPIVLFGIDYKSKTIVCTKQILPNGNFEEQMREIKEYYSTMTGKNPHSFTVGETN